MSLGLLPHPLTVRSSLESPTSTARVCPDGGEVYLYLKHTNLCQHVQIRLQCVYSACINLDEYLLLLFQKSGLVIWTSAVVSMHSSLRAFTADPSQDLHVGMLGYPIAVGLHMYMWRKIYIITCLGTLA